jgi:hypothetical protein
MSPKFGTFPSIDPHFEAACPAGGQRGFREDYNDVPLTAIPEDILSSQPFRKSCNRTKTLKSALFRDFVRKRTQY